MATITNVRTQKTFATLSAAISDSQTQTGDNITITGGTYSFSNNETLAIGEKHLTVTMTSSGVINKLMAVGKTVTVSGSSKTTSSIQFTIGNQLDIQTGGSNIDSDKVFTIRNTSVEVLMGRNDYQWATMAVEKGNPTLLIDNASLKVGMAADKGRDYMKVTGDGDKRYVSAALLFYTGNATINVANHSYLEADYLVHVATNALSVSDSTVSTLGANSVGSIKIGSVYYYRYVDGDVDVDGDEAIDYYAWKKWGESTDKVYTKTLQLEDNLTRYYNTSFEDTGKISEFNSTNKLENTGSGGIFLENSTLKTAAIKNTSRFDSGNNKGGIVLANSQVSVAARERAGSSSVSLTNSGTIDIKATATITLNGLSEGDNGKTITVKSDPADTEALYTVTLEYTGETAVLSSSKFTGGTDYYVTIGSGDAVQYTVSAPTIASGSSFAVTGKVTNSNSATTRAVISVDAYSSFSAESFVNKYGEFKIVYNPDNANAFSISSFNNSNGIITIDVTKYLENRETTPVATISGITFSSLSEQGTVQFVDSTGASVSDVYYKLNVNNEIVLGPQMIFVNAKWTDTSQIPATAKYKERTYSLVSGVNAFGKLQDAINAAASGATIVFFNTGGDTNVEDFKFYKQGLVTIKKDLFFESNTSNKAVKFDSLKINSGCTAEFHVGLYSLEDALENDGTLKIVKKTRFNGDLVKNANGIITVDKTSRLVAASIDAGVVEVRAGFVYNDLKWIECPYAAKIGDNTTIKLVYPYVEGISPSNEKDGVDYETRIIEGKSCQVVVETIEPGAKVYAKVDENGQYLCYGTAAHQGGAPTTTGWDSFYAATEYGGLQFIDDEFDLSDTDSDNIYNTAAIYVTKNGYRTATLSGVADDSNTLTVTGTGMAAGNYSCSVTVGDKVLNGKFVVDDSGNGSVAFEELAAGQYSIKLADPKYKVTVSGESVSELTLSSTGLVNGVDYICSVYSGTDVINSGTASITSGTATITLDDSPLAAGNYTVVLTKGATFQAKSQDLKLLENGNIVPHVTVSAEHDGNPIVYDSFMGAMNSVYIQGHTIGTPESGMVVRLQSGTYTEGDFSKELIETDDPEKQSYVGLGTNYNVIVAPDRWQDKDGQWHYDEVSMIFGGTFGGIKTMSNLMTFYKLKELTIGDWVFGRNSTEGKEEISVINFVDIENLTINYRLKPQEAATIRILNCNVTSNRHFSVPGGTLIIENSYVKLVGQTGHGALSTENNVSGSGTVIVRNSVFEVKDANANDLIVNLKVNCEFAISGTCTVSGIFMNIDEPNGSDTCIAFRDAILDENTNIRAGSNDTGAALRFEGYNVLDGSTVEQNGDRTMTVETGSTVEMSNGANITVGGEVEVSNCGSITLDNAFISAGSFSNEGDLTLTDGAEVNLVHNDKETGDGSNTLTVTIDDPFYIGRDVTFKVTDESGNLVLLVQPGDPAINSYTPTIKVTSETVTLTAAGTNTFKSGKKYTVSYDGYITNAENGTLTVDLQSDGSLGISGVNGSVVLENSGTLYIDLSRTDLPVDTGEGMYINLQNLTGDGDVVIVGGGGEYERKTGDHENRVKLTNPPTRTIYINSEWHNDAVYRKGTNVGSFTYFGYNAFENNPDGNPGTQRDLAFSSEKETSKIIYYGGNSNSYAGLNLATEENAPNQITLTTLETMSISTLSVEFSVGAGGARTVTIVVKDKNGKVIEKHNYNIDVPTTAGATFSSLFYSSALSKSAFDKGDYTFSIIDSHADNPGAASITNKTVTDLTVDRDTVTMAGLTTGTSQTVTLSGSTMSLNDTVTNNGTLKVGTGENAILEIPVAASGSIRNVKVKIQIGTSEEYHTVQAPAATGAETVTSVIVDSKSIAPGQQYTVSVSDIQQIFAEAGTGDKAGYNVLNVNVVPKETARNINVSARNAKGVKYTFTNVAVGADKQKVTLDPHLALDNTSGTVTGSNAESFSVVVDENGDFILNYIGEGTTTAQTVSAYVQKTVGDGIVRFDYTFDVKAGMTGEVGRISTRISDEGYYYVESEEPGVIVTAKVVDGISGSNIKAGDVTNNGTIVVASQKDIGELDLTGLRSGPEARTAQVTVMDGEFTVGTYDLEIGAGSTVASVVSSDFLAGRTYTATVTDTLFQTVNPSEGGTAPQLNFTVEAGEIGRSFTAMVTDSDTGALVGSFDVVAGVSAETITVVSGEFEADKSYTVTIADINHTINVTGSEGSLAFNLGEGAVRTVSAVVTDTEAGTVVGTYVVPVASTGDVSIASDAITSGKTYSVTIDESSQKSNAAAGGSAPQLTVTVEAGEARTVTAVVKDGDGNIVGTFDVAVVEDQTTISLVSSEFTDSTEGAYTVSIAGETTYSAGITENPEDAVSPRKAAKLVLDVDRNTTADRWIEVTVGDRTYSLFVAKGASKAELVSEDFTVGKEYSYTGEDPLPEGVGRVVTITDKYSVSMPPVDGVLKLTGLSSSDNIIRPDGNLNRTLSVKVSVGASDPTVYNISNDNIITDELGTYAVIGSGFDSDQEYNLEISDTKTVVATAETLAVFDSTGTVTNNAEKTITVTDAVFNAGTLTNESTGTITITNSQLTVGTYSNAEPPVFTGGAITNDGAITMDIDSLITAGSITNTGTITIDATSFNTDTTDMKKVIDLDNAASGTITGTGNLVLDASEAQFEAGIGILYDADGHDYWVVAADQSIVYVNSDWATDENGLAHKTGDRIEYDSGYYAGKKLYYGYNAFSTFTDAYAEALSARFYTVGDEGISSEPQTIGTIEVYETAAAIETDARDFRNQTTLTNLLIKKSTTNTTAVIPFTNAEGSVLTLIPANNTSGDPAKDKTITIDSGVTLQLNGTGSVHLGGDETTEPTSTTTTTNGKVVVNGGIKAEEGTIVVYGLTEVNSGTLNAESLNVTAADLLTVSGTSKLVIGNLSGSAIQLQSGAALTGSMVRGGAINSAYDFTFDSNNSMFGVTLTAADNTITNSGTLSINAATNISAGSINGTIDLKLETIESPQTVRTEANTLVSVTSGNLSSVTLIVDGDTENPVDLFKEGVTINDTTYTLVKTDTKIYLTTQTRETLYVNDAWKTASFGDLVTYADHTYIYGYNAFSSMSEITYSVTGKDQTTEFPTTGSIVFTGNEMPYSGGTDKMLYYTDGNLLLSGDAPASVVKIGTSRFYLMHKVAVTDEEFYASELAAAAGTTVPTITIDSNLTLDFTTGQKLLKVGDVLDSDTMSKGETPTVLAGGDFDGEDKPKRTAGVANLLVNGTVNGSLYLAPYSTASVSTTGKVLDATTTTYLRENSVLEVVGTGKTGPLQFQQGEVRFMNGGTLTLENTLASFKSVAIAPVECQITQAAKEDGAYAELNLTNTTVNATAPTGGFFVKGTYYDTTAAGNRKLHLNLSDHSTLNVTGDFNPLKDVTVNIDESTLSVTGAVTNNAGATIMVTDSDFEALSMDNHGTITFSGANANARIGVTPPSGAKGGDPEPEEEEELYNRSGKTITVENGATLNASTVTNRGTIMVTDATFNVTTLLDNLNGGEITVTNSSFLVGTVDSEDVFQGGAVTNNGTISITSETGSASTVRFGAVTNNSMISITSETGSTSTVRFGAVTNNSTINISGEGSEFEFGDLTFDNSGRINMDWKSALSFTGFNNGDNKLIIDMTDIDAAIGGLSGFNNHRKKILDYTGSGALWTEADYKNHLLDLAQTPWSMENKYTLFVKDGDLWVMDYFTDITISPDGDDDTATKDDPDFSTFAFAAGVNPTSITVVGENEYASTNAPVFHGVTGIIGDPDNPIGEDLNFATRVISGEAVQTSQNYTGVTSLTINDGVFAGFVVGADRVDGEAYCNRNTSSGEAEQTESIRLTINGGKFNNMIGGGMMNGRRDLNATGVLNGDIILTINGGEFGENCYIYGGSLALKKSYSTMNITGNVTTNVNVKDGETIDIKGLYAGSYGVGIIDGKTAIVLSAEDSDSTLKIHELWGGCSSDFYSKVDGSRTTTTLVSGTRTLSFTGFKGTLISGKVKMFSHLVCKDDSSVTLTPEESATLSLSDVANWEFECNSSLTGDFVNDFKNDNFVMDPTGLGSAPWTVMTNTRSTIASQNFDKFSSVKFGTATTEYNGKDAWIGGGYALFCSGNDMIFSTETYYNSLVAEA